MSIYWQRLVTLSAITVTYPDTCMNEAELQTKIKHYDVKGFSLPVNTNCNSGSARH